MTPISKKTLALYLGILTSLCLPSLQAEEAYFQRHFGKDGIGTWATVQGTGTLMMEGSVLDVTTKPSTDPAGLFATDSVTPEFENGFVETKVKLINGDGRIALVFRFKDAQNFAALAYDGGSWMWQTGKGYGGLFSHGISDGEFHKIRAEFEDKSLKVIIDDQIKFEGEIEAIDIGAGKLASKQWGNQEGYWSHAQYQYFRGGENLNAGDDSDPKTIATASIIPHQLKESEKTVHLTQAKDWILFSEEKISDCPRKKDSSAKIIEITSSPKPKIVESLNPFTFENTDSPTKKSAYSWSNNGTLKIKVPADQQGRTLSLYLKSHQCTPSIEVFNKNKRITKTTLHHDVQKVDIPFKSSENGDDLDIIITLQGGTGRLDIYAATLAESMNVVKLTPESVTLTQGTNSSLALEMDTPSPIHSLSIDNKDLTKDSDYRIEENKIFISPKIMNAIKSEGNHDLSLNFSDGYKTKINLFKPLSQDKAYLKKDDFTQSTTNFNTWESLQGKNKLTESKLGIPITPETPELFLSPKESPEVFNSEVTYTFTPNNDHGSYGAFFRWKSPTEWVWCGLSGNKVIIQNAEGLKKVIADSPIEIYKRRKLPYSLTVRTMNDEVSVYLDGMLIGQSSWDELPKTKGRTGIGLLNSHSGTLLNAKVKALSDITSGVPPYTPTTIQSEKLKVTLDKNFPAVLSYELAGNTEILHAQELPFPYIEINNKLLSPKITSDFSKDKATYHILAEGFSFDVIFSVKNNILEMTFDKLEASKSPIRSIHFPKHSLISLRSNSEQARLTTNAYEDSNAIFELSKKSKPQGHTTYAILNNKNIVATLSNNSIKHYKEITFDTIPIQDYFSTGLWSNEYLYRGPDGQIINTPKVQVIVDTDRNKDGTIDATDGAIAYRDSLMTPRVGSDFIRNSYSYVTMIFGSQAQYPFLRVLDNAKKINLGTDGFDQLVIIKGYQNEGHDSAHPDFAGINQRAGGEKDFKFLTDEAQKYNTKIGVHINHTESYPEAKQFSPELVVEIGGWAWLDASALINKYNDILNPENGMEKRLDDLKNKAPNLNFVYIDVYFDKLWPAYKIGSKINSLGWGLGTEYGNELSHYSTWSHWVKGCSTGSIAKIIAFQDQEVFGETPLFRGATGGARIGINGWQGEKDYNALIKRFFLNILPSKYLMNYPLMQWSQNKAVLGHDLEVVSEMINGQNVISKKGKILAEGNKLFIPWPVETESKIYHYSDNDQERTWDLPDSWTSLNQVYLYTLSDQGKQQEQVIPVTHGKITLQSQANTPYVLYREKAPKPHDMKWGDGNPIRDMGFDSYQFDYAWTKESTSDSTDHITFEKSPYGNTFMQMKGKKQAAITQKIAGLQPGQTYALSVYVETTHGRKATLSLSDGKTHLSNYTDIGNVPLGGSSYDKIGTNYQRLLIEYTVPENIHTAEIKLEASEGADDESFVRWDDVRLATIKKSEKKGHFAYEDFENVDQGFGILTCIKNNDFTHLSETHLPYTNDTLNGQFSLKSNSAHLRTLPQTLRLKPNQKYKLGFEYKAFNGDHSFSLKSDKAIVASHPKATLHSEKLTAQEPTKVNVEFTTDNFDDYYIEFLSDKGTIILDDIYVDELP